MCYHVIILFILRCNDVARNVINNLCNCGVLMRLVSLIRNLRLVSNRYADNKRYGYEYQ